MANISKIINKLSDFTIRYIILLTTIMALITFASYYPRSQLIFSFLALLLVIAILSKGITDIIGIKVEVKKDIPRVPTFTEQ